MACVLVLSWNKSRCVLLPRGPQRGVFDTAAPRTTTRHTTAARPRRNPPTHTATTTAIPCVGYRPRDGRRLSPLSSPPPPSRLPPPLAPPSRLSPLSSPPPPPLSSFLASPPPARGLPPSPPLFLASLQSVHSHLNDTSLPSRNDVAPSSPSAGPAPPVGRAAVAPRRARSACRVSYPRRPSSPAPPRVAGPSPRGPGAAPPRAPSPPPSRPSRPLPVPAPGRLPAAPPPPRPPPPPAARPPPPPACPGPRGHIKGKRTRGGRPWAVRPPRTAVTNVRAVFDGRQLQPPGHGGHRGRPRSAPPRKVRVPW